MVNVSPSETESYGPTVVPRSWCPAHISQAEHLKLCRQDVQPCPPLTLGQWNTGGKPGQNKPNSAALLNFSTAAFTWVALTLSMVIFYAIFYVLTKILGGGY